MPIRLINTESFGLQEFNTDVPPYAIVSHRWGATEDEVSFEDLVNHAFADPAHPKRNTYGYQKIKQCCALAANQEVEWAWIDTCCIDKRNNTELSAAINSMFRWYRDSYVCFAVLDTDILPEASEHETKELLESASWFNRGWTLQELLAPRSVSFYDAGARFLGTKEDLCKHLTAITGIEEVVLLENNKLQSASVAKRFSWVADRVTTVPEDMAYCLLGIFDVNMPLLYGEGNNAFIRLQEQIMARSNDESILAWPLPPPAYEATTDFSELYGILAPSPRSFKGCGDIGPIPNHSQRPPWQWTSKGLQFHVASFPDPDVFAALAIFGGTLPLRLECGHSRMSPSETQSLWIQIGRVERDSGFIWCRVRSKEPGSLYKACHRLLPKARLHTIYLAQTSLRIQADDFAKPRVALIFSIFWDQTSPISYMYRIFSTYAPRNSAQSLTWVRMAVAWRLLGNSYRPVVLLVLFFTWRSVTTGDRETTCLLESDCEEIFRMFMFNVLFSLWGERPSEGPSYVPRYVASIGCVVLMLALWRCG